MSESKKYSESFKRESQYTPEIIERASQVAREIMANPEPPIRSFQFGEKQGELYVSSDPKVVVGTETITVDGQIFYLGLFLR